MLKIYILKLKLNMIYILQLTMYSVQLTMNDEIFTRFLTLQCSFINAAYILYKEFRCLNYKGEFTCD